MRKWVARVCLLASALSLVAGGVDAQPKKKKGPAPARPPAAAPAAPAAGDTGQGPPQKGGAQRHRARRRGRRAPVTAGQMTEEAARRSASSTASGGATPRSRLYRVYKGETGDDEGNKQIAQYHLAIALYRLKFYQASYGIFSEIADKPNHLKFNETLLWLVEARDAAPRARRHRRARRQVQRRRRSRGSTTRSSAISTGSSTTCSAGTSTATAKYEEAIQPLREGRREESKYYVQAQFFRGISYVQLRKSVPAVQVVPAHRQRDRRGRRGRRGRGPHARPRVPLDGAHLLLGVGPPRREQRPDDRRHRSSRPPSSTGTRSTSRSEYWLDALFEESWAYFMAGDYPHALGNIHTIEAPYFPNSFYPEADILKAVIYFANCQYDDATTIVAQVQDEVRADQQGPRGGPQPLQGRGRKTSRSSSS